MTEMRMSRPKPKIDFTVEALDFKNVNLLRQFVTDQGRILPRKYTALPAHYQRRLNVAIKRARQMLLMK
jgi:small subunit ribosomal protein S18